MGGGGSETSDNRTEQSPLKCELSSRMGVKGLEDMEVENDTERQKKIKFFNISLLAMLILLI